MRRRLFIALLLAAVAVSYANTLANQFAMDDELYILRNLQVTEPSLHRWFSPNAVSAVFRPLTFATLAANFALGGASPAGYHLFNLLLHAAATLLLYILFLELLAGSLEGEIVAFAAALLYAVLPIHTEAVAWVVGRAELLAAGFLFAGWILHLRGRPAASLACFAAALLSKESAVVFLPLILLGDYLIGKWKLRITHALGAGLTMLYLATLWKLEGGRFGPADISMADNPLAHLPVAWRILNALRIAWKYAALQIYPAILSCDYSFNQIPAFRDWRHTLPAALAAAAVVGLWIWAVLNKRREWAIAGAIYFAGFAITANVLFPTGTVLGERLAYLPSAGLCLLLALGWNWIRRKQELVSWVLLGVIALGFSVRTVLRNREWHDALALYSSAVRAVPNDAKMHANLAGQYFSLKQLDAAAKEYQIALNINPESPDTLASYAALEFQRGRYQSAGAMMEQALSMSGRNNINYDSMVVTFAAILMKTNHLDGALAYLNREIAEDPGYTPARALRAEVHFERGEWNPAEADAQAAVSLNPQDEQARQVLGEIAAVRQGNTRQ